MEPLVYEINEKLMHLRIMMRHQYVTNHGQGSGIVLNHLDALASQGPLTITRISQEMNFTMAAATQMVKLLMRQGFLAKIKNPHDARMAMVQLTPKGKAHVNDVRQKHYAILNDLVSYLGLEDTREFDRIMDKVIGFLSQQPTPSERG